MKKLITAGAVLLTLGSVGAVAASTTPAPAPKPAEQQYLLAHGYSETASWGLFQKNVGGCNITIEVSQPGNYYIVTQGKRYFSAYPVPADQTATGAAFAENVCVNG